MANPPNKTRFSLPEMEGKPIHLLLPEKNTLLNRFRPWDVISTDAVLIIDDDVRGVTPNHLENAFRSGLRHSYVVKRLIGFGVRKVSPLFVSQHILF